MGGGGGDYPLIRSKKSVIEIAKMCAIFFSKTQFLGHLRVLDLTACPLGGWGMGERPHKQKLGFASLLLNRIR